MSSTNTKYKIARNIKAIVLVLVMTVTAISGLINSIEALTITNVDPEKGPVGGGQEVVIEGDFGEVIGVKQVVNGSSHSCALDTLGHVYCWGSNAAGQLGDNTTTDRHTPVAVQLGDRPDLNVKQITAGTSYTCAIASDDQAYCWGWNYTGRLGDGTTTDRHTPVAVQLGDRPDLTVKKIIVGVEHTCAIASNDEVYCWGRNQYGQLGDGTTINRNIPTLVDFPEPTYTVTMDADGTPAPCVDVVIASDGLRLTCTTTAHSAGFVDITISDGVNEEVLVNGYEYIALTLTSDSTTHTIKLNIYDSTSLADILDFCDQVKADQEANNTYTTESYERLMQECEEGRDTLECLETAEFNNTDASECGDPEDTEDIEDAIENLKLAEKPGGPTTPRPGGKSLPPSTGSTWYVNILGRNYAMPVIPLITLSIAMLASIGLAIFLIRRHIGAKGISGVKVSNPWSKNAYEASYVKGIIGKHADDPLTEVIDVSNIIRKYRIKYTLWHAIPTISIVAAFLVLILTTAPTMADSEYADISLTTVGSSTVTMINVNKYSSGNANSYGTKIQAINTDVHSGGTVGEDSGVYVMYGLPSPLSGHLAMTATQTTPANNPLPNVTLSGIDQLTIPAEFDSTTLEGQHTFNHAITLDLTNILTIANGSYSIELTYTLTAEEPLPPEPPLGSFDTGCGEHHNGDYSNFKGYVGSMQTFVDTWDIYDYGIATDERNDQDYYICKLPDEHVWMLNNLKIGLSEITDASLTLSNPGINTATLSTQTAPSTSTSGVSYTNPGYYDPTCGETGAPSSPNCGNNDITSDHFYGYLYNWCAATGGTSTTCTASGTMPDEPSTDICPTNWRLPTGGATGEFAWLNAKMNNPSATAPSTLSGAGYVENWRFTGPFRGVFSGYWLGAFDNQDGHGHFWSSSRSLSSSGAFYMSFYISAGGLDYVYNRINGLGVRCLLGGY